LGRILEYRPRQRVNAKFKDENRIKIEKGKWEYFFDFRKLGRKAKLFDFFFLNAKIENLENNPKISKYGK